MDAVIRKELYQLMNYEPGIAGALEEALVEGTFNGNWPSSCAYGTAARHLSDVDDDRSYFEYTDMRMAAAQLERSDDLTPLEEFVMPIRSRDDSTYGEKAIEGDANRADLLKTIRRWRKKNERQILEGVR